MIAGLMKIVLISLIIFNSMAIFMREPDCSSMKIEITETLILLILFMTTLLIKTKF